MKGKHGKHHEEQEERKRGGGCHKSGGRSCHKDGGDPGAEAARGKSPKPAKADGNPFVIKEAEKSKDIGKVGGIKSKHRADRKRGGGCRASGGGADASPYSSAGRGLHHKHGGSCH